ncbi:hypothetical protein KY084_13765 [Stakelama sp. CBK3Z-3]|uniref:Lipoprotein n=1 Tax=Stakelama flava TaxID=2860338 RepID=A0ABS6XR98_9SPHN|nr:hypothetical protein [Stakelama flava]MBW4331935.1 hypothetical protein [Stakelama flava]
MIAAIAIVTFSPAAIASPVRADAVCAIGKALLHDIAIPADSGNGPALLNPERPTPSLFDRCPDLRQNLPQGLKIADAETLARASQHGPQSLDGDHIGVYQIAPPEIKPGTNLATISVTYECRGLCGQGLTFRYRKNADGVWVEDGKPRTNWVS